MALPAETAFGAYRILDLLGEGGMGEVYRAYQPSLAREVALKVIRPHLAADPAFRARFLREASVLARLEHPNIVPIYEVGEVAGRPYLSSRYLRGGTLHALVGSVLPPAQVVALLEPVADALDFAHGLGFLHRDIKPANILLSEPDGRGRQTPVIADFGLARLAEAESSDAVGAPLTQTGIGMGTPAYTAPEQALGRAAVDGRVDQYSLAVVAFQLLTGGVPFSGASPTEILLKQVQAPPPPPSSRNPALPRAVDAVLLRALAKEPADRYPSCAAFLAALAAATASAATIAAWPATPAAPPTPAPAPSPSEPALPPTVAAHPPAAPSDESHEWVRPVFTPRAPTPPPASSALVQDDPAR